MGWSWFSPRIQIGCSVRRPGHEEPGPISPRTRTAWARLSHPCSAGTTAMLETPYQLIAIPGRSGQPGYLPQRPNSLYRYRFTPIRKVRGFQMMKLLSAVLVVMLAISSGAAGQTGPVSGPGAWGFDLSGFDGNARPGDSF